MEKTPDFEFDVEQSDLQRLYDANNFETVLKTCVANEIPDPDAGTHKLLMHEVFCCKKRTTRYSDAVTGDEIALIADVTPTGTNPRKPYRIISRLRVGNTVYEAAVPKG